MNHTKRVSLYTLLSVLLGLFAASTASANLSLNEGGMTSDFDADGQSEIVRIVRDDPGGSGTFYHLLVIDTDENGELRSTSTLLGDRIQFLNFWKDNNLIAIDMVQAGEEDAACCPTQKIVRRWQFQDGKLIEQPAEPYGQVSIKDLVKLKWKLIQMGDQKIDADTDINLTFGQEMVGGKSGCNNYSTSAKEPSPGKLKIAASMAATMMACTDKQMSLEQQFLKRLEQVESYRWMGDYMTLEWQDKENQGSLVFQLIKE